MLESYTYATTDESGLDEDGWVNGGATALADRELEPGQSVLINTVSDCSVTFAGQVKTTKTEVNGVAGFNFVGNPYPVSIDVNDIKLDPETATSWEDNIQILDEGGGMSESYTYATKDESGLDEDGWVNGGATALAVREITAGLGVLVNTASDGVKITIISSTVK